MKRRLPDRIQNGTALAFLFCLILSSCTPSAAPIKSYDVPVEPLMGDWLGHRVTSTGAVIPIAAQFVPLGGKKYQVSLHTRFDSRDPNRMTYEVHLDGDRILLPDHPEWKGTMGSGKIYGETTMEEAKTIQLQRLVRTSPNLGATPPVGAIILFDGKESRNWEQVGKVPGLVSLANILGGNDRVGYIRTEFSCPNAEDAVLEIGSDDGVKAWLNGTVVDSKNVSRGLMPGEDKVNVRLQSGKNTLMLKVTQGGGGWGACVRIVDGQRKPLTSINPRTEDGYITEWSVAGPFMLPGKTGAALFDEVFPPENFGTDVSLWKPAQAISGESSMAWELVDGAMEVTPGTGSIVTRQKFTDFQLHLEFRTPFMPEARGQARGNSGVYLQGRYEVQVLDSYGLAGEDNECGGIYKVAAPRVNMCAPPGQWQSYDVTFQAPRYDGDGKKLGNAVATIRHNGVIIHENLEIPGPTGGALDEATEKPGGICLQDHGDRVQYRNIWLVERHR